jgi:hypothetical protein
MSESELSVIFKVVHVMLLLLFSYTTIMSWTSESVVMHPFLLYALIPEETVMVTSSINSNSSV